MSNIKARPIFEELHHEIHGEIPKQKYRIMSTEERIHSANNNGSHPLDGAMLSSVEESHSHGSKARSYSVDIPLLITMSAWFVMLYVGISKFIQVNAPSKDPYKKYMQGFEH